MAKYLLSVVQPTGGVPGPEVLDRIMTDVDAVNDAMQRAGVWVFGAGLHSPDTATTLRPTGSGDVLVTDGPYVETKEHLGGFTVVEVADLDAALGWGRRLSLATTLPIEVRPFQEG
ncbi:YciI family protein [Saccharothrix sp. Mg75]|uniref:YciI family protein n=1 Tax=Saccharothrix sp. Mg75 TaxID=3445357 RepID=UPI003EEC5678